MSEVGGLGQWAELYQSGQGQSRDLVSHSKLCVLFRH